MLLGFVDGGYYASTWRWATLALGTVIGIQLVLRRARSLSAFEVLSVVSLAALTIWMLLSALWGVHGTEATTEAERCALYAVGVGAMLIVLTPSTTRALRIGLLVGIVALAAFALAERVVSPPELDPYQGSLLKEPVGYANALGMLMALGVVLAFGLHRETRSRGRRRAFLGAAIVSATALALTSSRGAWLATLVGLGVLAILRSDSQWRRRVSFAGAVVVAVALAMLVGPRVSLGDRPAYWHVAIQDAAGHPIVGSGAGSYDDYWLEERPIPAYVRDAHSLYLETAAELGVVGLVLLLVALGTPLVAASRHLPREAAVTAAYATFLVHAGLDWDWEMPVTTLAGLACGAALLAGTRASRLSIS